MSHLDTAESRLLAPFDLSARQLETVFGELYRHSGEWRFTAVGQGYAGGLAAMCKQYGINV